MTAPFEPRVRPPFEPLNEAATKHGADSRRRWQPIADQLAADLLAERPWLAGHRRSVHAWARVEAQAQLIGAWLDEHGLVDDDGEPRAAGNRLDRLEIRAQSLRNDLAEPPMAMARLLSTLTSTAVSAGSDEMLEGLKAESDVFVDAYLRSLTAPPALASAEDRS